MLLSRPTKYGSGILLYGDYYDLRNIHETIHALLQGAPLESKFEDLILGLAHDIRKAYEGEREKLSLGFDPVDRVKYRGVKILWPYFLVELGLLRWSAGFHPTTREQQANLYRLEACAEIALISYDPEAGRDAIEWLARFSGLPTTYLPEFITEVNLRYASSFKAGKDRFRQLPRILRMIDPLTNEYKVFEKRLHDQAKKLNCSPLDLQFGGNFPRIKW